MPPAASDQSINVWGFRQKEGAIAAVAAALFPADNGRQPLNRLYRDRDAGDFNLDGAEVVSAAEIQGFPVVAAKGHVGRGGRAMHDAAELFALRVHDPDPAGAAAIDIAFDIDLHAVGDAGLIAAQIDEDA